MVSLEVEIIHSPSGDVEIFRADSVVNVVKEAYDAGLNVACRIEEEVTGSDSFVTLLEERYQVGIRIKGMNDGRPDLKLTTLENIPTKDLAQELERRAEEVITHDLINPAGIYPWYVRVIELEKHHQVKSKAKVLIIPEEV